jgi:hypothetical protein
MPIIEHKEPAEFGDSSGFDGSLSSPMRDIGDEQNLFQQKDNQPVQNLQQPSNGRELELISAKLDSIKLILEDLDRRVKDIEKIARTMHGAHKSLPWINRRR